MGRAAEVAKDLTGDVALQAADDSGLLFPWAVRRRT